MVEDMEKIQIWCSAQQLKINISKTKLMIMDNHRNIPNQEHYLGLNFNNQSIERVKQLNYLGLVFDNRLTWNELVSKLRDKRILINFAIYKAKNTIPKKQLWMIYDANFLAHINYLNPIWNKAADLQINSLQRLQNKVVKTIECKSHLTPTNSLYSEK